MPCDTKLLPLISFTVLFLCFSLWSYFEKKKKGFHLEYVINIILCSTDNVVFLVRCCITKREKEFHQSDHNCYCYIVLQIIFLLYIIFQENVQLFNTSLEAISNTIPNKIKFFSDLQKSYQTKKRPTLVLKSMASTN